MAGFTSIRSYFRTRMNALGYSEWKDALNVDNIPDTLLSRRGRMYHIETPSSSRADAYDPQSQDVDQDVVLRVFLKGYRYPADAVDAAMSVKDTILEDVLSNENRLGASLKNIFFNSDQLIALNDQNDNSLILEMSFSCRIILCV